mgnify:CR=1 FL=1
MAKSERISEKSEKIIVVDTNVILFDAQAIFKFKDASVHIPISVLEEIDRFKRDMGENLSLIHI